MPNHQHAHLVHPQYRPDVDGLRAVAILAVVLYHAFPESMPGGFIGVDIFFVISGFLISTIIFSSLERDRFSLVEFYVRRARRIFPALILTLAASLALGWFILLPDEYKQLARHTFAGAAFIQNFLLWRESGYFDNAAETKPLLHLWSLGIEEQFYILWPLLLAFMWKRRWSFLKITAGIALTSFAANIYLMHRIPTAGFYLPMSRLWELMVGGLLAYTIQHRPHLVAKYRDGQSALGFILIAIGLLLLDRGRQFPGWWALLPTLGALFVISAGQNAWLNEKLLANKLMVGIGLISYPLYLWHWPLLSFARTINNGVLHAKVKAMLLIFASVLSIATYRFVEIPSRKHFRHKSAPMVATLLIVVIGLLGLTVYREQGVEFRQLAVLSGALPDYAGGPQGNTVNECGIDDPAKKQLFAFCAEDKRGHIKYALIGDSKASALFGGLVRTSSTDGRWLFIGGAGKHGPLVPLLSDDPELSRFQPLVRAASEAIANNEQAKIVVIATAVRALFQLGDGATEGSPTYDPAYIDRLKDSRNFARTFAGLSNTVGEFVRHGKKVVILIDNPALPNPTYCRTRKLGWPFSDWAPAANVDCTLSYQAYVNKTALYHKLLADLKRKYKGRLELFDATGIYCDKSLGSCAFQRNGHPLYSFTDHVSDYAAGLVGTRLNAWLSQIDKPGVSLPLPAPSH